MTNRQQKFKDEETTENEFSEQSDSQNNRDQLLFRGLKNNQKDEQKSPSKSKIQDQKSMSFMAKYKNPVERTIWTIFMLVGFIIIINAGHFYISILTLMISVAMFKEILSQKRNYDKELKIPLFHLINWYFFIVAVFFFYGKLFSSKLTKYVLRYEIISFIVHFHNIISFMLWIVGFLVFVLSLKQGYYRYQFRMFGWTHLTLMMFVAQSSFMVQNVFEGLVWFILPALLVITNDIMAYIFGISFGKTKLIELSPKKTWEGFIGGSISTLFAAFILAKEMQKYNSLICPMQEIVFVPFEIVSCQPQLYFILKEYITPIGIITFSEFQIHAMILSLFASLIAPFGGFFASGFKRAIKIKDFADVIPGHGGVTDRMDCQILNGMFTYLYLHQVILSRLNTVSSITSFIAGLPSEDQLVIYKELQQLLQKQNLI